MISDCFQKIVPYMEPCMALRDFFNRTVSVQRYTLTESEHSAAGAETLVGDPNNVRCCIQPLAGRELEIYGKTTGEVTHRAFLPIDVLLKPQDRLMDGNDRFEVVSVLDAAGRGHHQEVLLVQRLDAGWHGEPRG